MIDQVASSALFKIGGKIIITHTIVWTWIIMLFIILLAIFVRVNLRLVPKNNVQNMIEMLIALIKNMVVSMMGEEGMFYFPLVATIAIFVVISNIISTIPTFRSPTADLNTTFAFGFVVFLVAQTSGLVVKKWVYIKGYFEPIFLWFPLNIIGELGKLVSHSFRLFGNIVGGTIIVIIMGQLFGQYAIPGLLNAWFGVIVGIIQAFVFFILAVAYIMVQIK